MCTLVLLLRPTHPWPLLLAANRDEMAERPWRGPGRHWPEWPTVVAGLDVLAGGTWLGRNSRGVIAAVLNRVNTLGPTPGRRSRGELPLIALAEPTAERAAAAIAAVQVGAYRGFNMVIADAQRAFVICTVDGDGQTDPGAGATLKVEPVPPGISMVTAYDRNDQRSPRIRRYLPQFIGTTPPSPDTGDWGSWCQLLASREADPDAGPGGAMTVVTTTGFGTVSASLLALPSNPEKLPIWLFAPGEPGGTPFTRVGP